MLRYTFIFAGLAILLVVAVFVRNTRMKSDRGSSTEPTHSGDPSRAARQERKRRRAQSRHDRRKRG